MRETVLLLRLNAPPPELTREEKIEALLVELAEMKPSDHRFPFYHERGEEIRAGLSRLRGEGGH